MKLDLFDKAILKVLHRFNIPLSTRMVGIKARMHPLTAKNHLERLGRNSKVHTKKIGPGKRVWSTRKIK